MSGHGNCQMCGTDKFGFPRRHRTNKQIHFGFQTGDIIKSSQCQPNQTEINHNLAILSQQTLLPLPLWR
jgi:hypothetical protein